MKIKTEVLQKMVAKSIQGASFNKMIPLTSLIGIKYVDDNLILTTTDGSNQLKVSMTEVQLGITEKQPNFYTIVNADTFSKLVSKTTKEFIELENKDNYLEVTGNGTYKLEIAINEEGEMVKFPTIDTLKDIYPYPIDTKVLQEAIKITRASTAKTMELPCLTGYYIADNIITTNREMICIMQNSLTKEPILLSNEIAELVLLIDNETISVYHKDNNLILDSTNYTIIGKELEGKDIYPVSQITDTLNVAYKNTIKVNKQELLNVLDRMNLFVTDYDKGGIYLDFTEAGLIIRSQKSNAEEIIEIEGSLEPEDRFNCLIDIEMLKAQVETILTDVVEIAYGQDTSIKIVDGKVIHIISLAQKE